jgi:PilZ domain
MPAQPGKAASISPERRHRRFARYRCNFPVRVKVLASGQYKQLDAHCKDLSEAGIGLLIAAELNISEVASLEFGLPGSAGSWEVRSVLRHRRGYHYGFEFLSLPPQLHQLIQELVKNLDRAD